MPVQFLRILFLGLFCLLTANQALGQEKINISAGLGHPELLNLGVRFQLEQSQLGLSAGLLPNSDDEAFAVAGDYYYHFGGASELSTRKPWFAKAGLNYYNVKNEFEKNQYLFLVPRIGRDFNLSRKVGIALEGGISLVLSRKEIELKPRAGSGFFDGSGETGNIFPSLGINVFYRL